MVFGVILLPSYARHVLLVAQPAMALSLRSATLAQMSLEQFTIYNGGQIHATRLVLLVHSYQPQFLSTASFVVFFA